MIGMEIIENLLFIQIIDYHLRRRRKKTKNFIFHFAQNIIKIKNSFLFSLLSMSKLIFYFFTIIFFTIIFNLVSTVPEQKINTQNSVPIDQSKTLAKTDDEDDELNDIFYDDPIDIKKPVVIIRKSNGIRTISIQINSFLLIGFIYSICLI